MFGSDYCTVTTSSFCSVLVCETVALAFWVWLLSEQSAVPHTMICQSTLPVNHIWKTLPKGK